VIDRMPGAVTLRSPNVLCQDDDEPLTRQMVQYRVLRASRRAKVSQEGYTSRHTFCPHLAMRGAPPPAILRARHDPALHAPESRGAGAIRLLDRPATVKSLETFWRRKGL
jgi:hypothetical protein